MARSAVAAVLATALLAAGACDTGTDPDVKPTEARIRVDGSSPGALRLVVSTDFFEGIADNGEIFQVFNDADTVAVEPPDDRRIALTDLGSIVVELSNPADEPADVRLRVDLDSGQDSFDRSATMSEGGKLRYVFVFLRAR